MTHAEIQELLGAYALDAVHPAERATIDVHLEVCPRCRAEVDEHLQAASGLGQSEQGSAPDGLWERISGGLRVTSPPRTKKPLVAWGSRRVSVRLAGALAAGAVVLAAVLGFRTVQQGHRLDAMEAEAARPRLLRAAEEADNGPLGVRITLRSIDSRIAARLVLLPDGTGYLIEHNLPELSENRTYQLWALVDGEPVSVGVLGNRPQVVAFRATVKADGFAITEEAAGGVAVTRNQPLVAGFVEA